MKPDSENQIKGSAARPTVIMRSIITPPASTTRPTVLKRLCSNTTGSYNTANGFQALNSNMTGSTNTASGFNALAVNTTGSNTKVANIDIELPPFLIKESGGLSSQALSEANRNEDPPFCEEISPRTADRWKADSGSWFGRGPCCRYNNPSQICRAPKILHRGAAVPTLARQRLRGAEGSALARNSHRAQLSKHLNARL
jgi:hypothetical protein